MALTLTADLVAPWDYLLDVVNVRMQFIRSVRIVDLLSILMLMVIAI